MITPPMGQPTIARRGRQWVVRAYNPATHHVTAFRCRHEADALLHLEQCRQWVVNINPKGRDFGA